MSGLISIRSAPCPIAIVRNQQIDVPGLRADMRRTDMQRTWIALGCLAGFGAVAMAAYAAHGVSDPAAIRIVGSGVQMQGWHALALVGTGLWSPRGGRLADAAGAAFALGLILFCGAVYSLALAHLSWGRLAPTGGILLMIGWLLLGASALRAR
jgi:uncharacterized membrane protein YgdD (TMEM256/DUF423 family)